jgi:lipid-binding SYLF domain-containing protein
MKKTALTLLLTLTCVAANAAWVADPANGKQVASATAIEQIKERIPRSQPFFEDAYAMAVYPSVTRLGFGFGGATGKGFVIEGDTIIGTSRYSQFTSGIQAGVRNFSMVVLFKDKEALEYFKKGKAQFMGQAGLAAGTKGIAGTPAFSDGVVIFTVTRLGLMGEFTVSGAKFSYRPLPGSGEEKE